MDTILIFVETKGDEPRKVSLELLSEGRKLASAGRFSVDAVIMGQLASATKDKLLAYADRLINLNDPVLATYSAEAYSLALAAYARETNPKMILAGATRTGRDFMPRVAVLLQSGIASDVTGVAWSDDPPTFVRPMYGGKLLAQVSFPSYPVIATTRPNTFAVDAPGDKIGEFVEKQIGIVPDKIKTRVLRVEDKAKGAVDLTESDVIVSGGRGLKAAENFKLLENLAEVVGATVGATRSVVDAKWRDQEDQVGKSGKTVSPKLYIAAGISGAIHHIMGMGTSKVILAINNDPNAPIFKYADYGIVGDLFEVVPALTAEFKKAMGK